MNGFTDVSLNETRRRQHSPETSLLELIARKISNNKLLVRVYHGCNELSVEMALFQLDG